MKITENIYLVGSGKNGIFISNRADSHVYLIESPGGHVMIDAGVGIDVDRIIENIRKDGLNPKDVKHLFITHVHSDH
ncbi:MAG: MBL fold metallo-hydrolase, partial [Candidatus Latescibacterota bacterium]